MWIDDYDDANMYCYGEDNDDDIERDTEPPTGEDTPIVHIKGSNCRVCNLYNHYMGTDNVVDDNKHTCYNCINSPYRWKTNIPKEKINDLKKYYKHIFKKNKPYNFDY